MTKTKQIKLWTKPRLIIRYSSIFVQMNKCCATNTSFVFVEIIIVAELQTAKFRMSIYVHVQLKFECN